VCSLLDSNEMELQESRHKTRTCTYDPNSDDASTQKSPGGGGFNGPSMGEVWDEACPESRLSAGAVRGECAGVSCSRVPITEGQMCQMLRLAV